MQQRAMIRGTRHGAAGAAAAGRVAARCGLGARWQPTAATSDGRATPASTPANEHPPGYPTLIYPTQGVWLWDKAPPKSSLKNVPAPPGPDGQPQFVDRSGTAAGWILNVIEITHWASFGIGFAVAYLIFDKTAVLAPLLGGDSGRVFFLILGLLSQVFGGGICGNLMHRYEGWQVAPFRSPLESSDRKYPVDDFNNAWLRGVAYEFLFAFQTLGLTFFNFGVFGLQPWNVALGAVSLFVAYVGPREPRLFLTNPFYQNGQPVFPLPAALLAVFVVTATVNLAAYVHLFAGAVHLPAWLPAPPEWVPVGAILSAIPPALIGFGGVWEGLVAECTFDQWMHELAFVGLNTGLLLVGVLFWVLTTGA